VRYLLVLWLFVLSAVAYLDRTNISIAAVRIGREFNINNTHLGLVISAFLIGYASFQIPAGLLAKCLGPRRILALGAVWWSVFTVLTTLVPPGVRSAVIILMLVRFGLGAGEATMYPATSLFVERWFPVQERGKANGLIFGGVGIGSGLTPPLVTAIMLHYGWRASFWFSAAVGLLVGLVWYIAARDTPDAHPMVGDEERKLIDGGRFLTAAAAPTPAHPEKQKIPWSLIFSSRATLALTLSYFSFGYIAWIFFGWFFIYMAQVRGLNLKASALYSMLPFIAMTAGCLLGGVLSDWLARIYSLRVGRCLLSSVCLAITAVFMILGSRAHSPVVAGVVLACGAGALYISQSSYWAVSADIAGEYVSVVSGMMNMGGQIGGAITASLTPLIASYFGWEVSFVAAAVIALAGALAWLAIDPRRDVLIVR